jgi:hypothetical protein
LVVRPVVLAAPILRTAYGISDARSACSASSIPRLTSPPAPRATGRVLVRRRLHPAKIKLPALHAADRLPQLVPQLLVRAPARRAQRRVLSLKLPHVRLQVSDVGAHDPLGEQAQQRPRLPRATRQPARLCGRRGPVVAADLLGRVDMLIDAAGDVTVTQDGRVLRARLALQFDAAVRVGGLRRLIP